VELNAESELEIAYKLAFVIPLVRIRLLIEVLRSHLFENMNVAIMFPFI
jgi:hypothetical protein